MTKSRLNKKGLLIVGAVIGLLIIFILWSLTNIKWRGNEILGVYFILTWVAVLISAIFVLLRDTRDIEINDRQIVFRNWLTGRQATYRLSDLDGFVTLYEIANGRQIRTIYLIKDKRFFGKISEFWYANFVELNTGVDGPLRHLGGQSWNILKSIKIFLGRQIELE